MRPLRVLTVIPTLGRGGAERQVANLVRGSRPDDLEHIVVQLSPPADFAADIREAGGRVIDLGLSGRRPIVRAARAVAGIIRRERPDVMKTDLFDANLSAVLARLVAGRVPLVTTLHNLDYESSTIAASHLPPRRVEVLRRIDRLAVRSGATYVACSHAVAQSAIEHLAVPAQRMHVIYNSVDPDEMRAPAETSAAVRRELGIDPDALVVLTIGRHDPQKAQDVLVRAFAAAAPELGDAHLVIVGRGPGEAMLRGLAADGGVAERVHLTGPRTDVSAVLGAADVFALPSWFEGFPVALVEAMSAGLPIVASAIGPNEEAVTDGVSALLVPPGSDAALADALVEMAKDPARRADLGAAAAAVVDARFRTETIAAAWSRLLRAVAA